MALWRSLDMDDDIKNLIINQSPGNIYWKDAQGRYLGCNQNFLDICGFKDHSDLIGKTDREIFAQSMGAEQICRIEKADQDVMDNKETIILEELGVDLSGNEAFYITKKVPLIDKFNSVIGLFGNSINITDKKLKEQLQQEKRILEHQNNAVKISAGAIAHDLRTPLSSIRLAMNALVKYWGTITVNCEYVSTNNINLPKINPRHLKLLSDLPERVIRDIQFSENYITSIINNINDGDVDPSLLNIYDASTIVNEALKEYPYENSESDLVFFNPKDTFLFKGIDFHLKNIIFNLLRNSLYYIKESGRGSIVICLEKKYNSNNIVFLDTAKGASKETIGHIFKEFYSTRETGTGIGLSFCKRIIQSFGGSIEAESEENKFMKITLKFPPTSLL